MGSLRKTGRGMRDPDAALRIIPEPRQYCFFSILPPLFPSRWKELGYHNTPGLSAPAALGEGVASLAGELGRRKQKHVTNPPACSSSGAGGLGKQSLLLPHTEHYRGSPTAPCLAPLSGALSCEL